MSTFRNPVGPRSSRVYWRRRLLVLLGIVAVIAIIVLIVVHPGSGDVANAPETSSSGEPDTSAEPSATPSEPIEGAECDPTNVKLDAVTDTNVYAAGQIPQLSFRITNTGAVSCTYDLSATQQSFMITSGAEQYWSSKDCQSDAEAVTPITLEPNVPQTSTPIPWDRTRSSAQTCDVAGEAVPAGGATYNLKVAVGPVESELTSFLLN